MRARLAAGVIAISLVTCTALAAAEGGAPDDRPLENIVPAGLPAGADPAEAPRPDSEQVAAAAAKEQAAEQSRRTPAAIEAREDSQTAFEALSAAEAGTLFEQRFGDNLPSLVDPLAGAEVRKFYDDFTARVDPPGADGNALVRSVLPLRTEGGERIDLSLEDKGDAVEPASPAVPVELPDRLSQGLAVGEAGIGVDVAGASSDDPSASEQPKNRVFYGEVRTDTDVLAEPTQTGVEAYFQLRSAKATEDQALTFDLPDGASLEPSARGASIVDGNERLADVLPPAATDAQGRSVPVHYEANGSTLTVHIDHHGGDYAYPILVDPLIQSWPQGANGVQGTSQYTASAGNRWYFYSSFSNGFVGADAGTWLSSYGSGPGLYVYAHVGWTFPAHAFGEWLWWAPGQTTFIPRFDYGPVYSNHFGDSTNDSVVSLGLWSTRANQFTGTQDHAGELSNQSGSITAGAGGTSSDVAGTNVAAFALTQPSGGYRAQWGDAYLGGASLYLDDPEAPTLADPAYASPLPSGWVRDLEDDVTLAASDPGLGVQSYRLAATNSAETAPTQDYSSSCVGTRDGICSASSSHVFHMDSDDLPEGVNTLAATAADPVAHRSTSKDFTLKVDRTAPEIDLSGELYEGRSDVSDETSRTLHVAATDARTDRATAGVKSIEVKVDGQDADPSEFFVNQDCAAGGCAFTHDFNVVTADWEHSSHTIEVQVIDHAGNTAQRSFDVAPAPAVAGDAAVGASLRASAGAVSGSPTYTYRWQRCGVDGSNCADIAGATAETYTVSIDDVQARLRAQITIHAADGSTTDVTTEQTEAVAPDRPADVTGAESPSDSLELQPQGFDPASGTTSTSIMGAETASSLEQDFYIYSGGAVAEFIQKMPSTKTVRQVTLGDLRTDPSCGYSELSAKLSVRESTTGRQVDMNTVATASTWIPAYKSRVSWPIPATTFHAGYAYEFRISNQAGGCGSKFKLTTWAHGDSKVNGGSGPCDFLAATTAGSYNRFWHEQGQDDGTCADLARPSSWDRDLPTGWILTGPSSGNVLVQMRPVATDLNPGGSFDQCYYGSHPVYWKTVNSYKYYACVLGYFSPPGADREIGWHYGADAVNPRDAYLRLGTETSPDTVAPGSSGDFDAALESAGTTTDLSWAAAEDSAPGGGAGSGVESYAYRYRRGSTAWTAWATSPYEDFEVPDGLANESIELEVRAVDARGNAGPVVADTLTAEEHHFTPSNLGPDEPAWPAADTSASPASDQDTETGNGSEADPVTAEAARFELCEGTSVLCGSFNGRDAGRYARKWSKTERGNRNYSYQSGTFSDGTDCTNFVSQGLKAGGMRFMRAGGLNRPDALTQARRDKFRRGKGSWWAYYWETESGVGTQRHYKVSESFVLVQKLYEHLLEYRLAEPVGAVTDLRPGDLVFYNDHGTSVDHLNHVQMVSRITGDHGVLVSQHGQHYTDKSLKGRLSEKDTPSHRRGTDWQVWYLHPIHTAADL